MTVHEVIYAINFGPLHLFRRPGQQVPPETAGKVETKVISEQPDLGGEAYGRYARVVSTNTILVGDWQEACYSPETKQLIGQQINKDPEASKRYIFIP